MTANEYLGKCMELKRKADTAKTVLDMLSERSYTRDSTQRDGTRPSGKNVTVTERYIEAKEKAAYKWLDALEEYNEYVIEVDRLLDSVILRNPDYSTGTHILYRYYISGKSYENIATELKLSVSSVFTLRRKVIPLVQEAIDERGGTGAQCE